ncbi:M16 family metallopeptidase [Lactobacillus sp. PV034]|uniref:M16 family metallopeptidase n=1 Tax=Lactobacillus sp. PV034 TaxID=2594495 RepID=UPI00223F0E9C|nr:insulinase family protein [Lactobacillus sp. PV034]QNQ80734.1 insulinase family protein [Lactobacillus sp. PV034]
MRNLEVFKRTFPSGFKAQVICRPKFYKKFMGIIVDFGGSDTQELSGGAHFLEHKLYAKTTGDISKRIEALNAITNAFTSYNETMFYVEFLEHWRQVIPLLFELVGTTHFTEKNVKKEAQIISQELAMYQDEPSWQLNHDLFGKMYPKTNLAEDLTGTSLSLQKMTPEILSKIYAKNYYSGNLEFVACGGFSKNQAHEILREVGKLQEKYFRSLKKRKNSWQDVQSSKIKDGRIKGSANIPMIGVGIKLPDFYSLGLPLTKGQVQILVEMMLEARLGASSIWFEEAQKAELLATPLSINVTYTRQGNYAIISGSSDKPEKLLNEIKRQVQFGSIVESNFNLQRKIFLANNIRECDQIENLAIEEAEYSLDGESRSELYQKIQTIGFSEFCQIYEKILNSSEIFSTILEKEIEE